MHFFDDVFDRSCSLMPTHRLLFECQFGEPLGIMAQVPDVLGTAFKLKYRKKIYTMHLLSKYTKRQVTLFMNEMTMTVFILIEFIVTRYFRLSSVMEWERCGYNMRNWDDNVVYVMDDT